MKSVIMAFALFTCGIVVIFSSATANDRQDDVAILTEKKVAVWPKLYAERDAAGLDDFLADGFKVLEPDGTVRTKAEEIAWLQQTPPDEAQSDFLFTIEEIVFASSSRACCM